MLQYSWKRDMTSFLTRTKHESPSVVSSKRHETESRARQKPLVSATVLMGMGEHICLPPMCWYLFQRYLLYKLFARSHSRTTRTRFTVWCQQSTQYRISSLILPSTIVTTHLDSSSRETLSYHILLRAK